MFRHGANVHITRCSQTPFLVDNLCDGFPSRAVLEANREFRYGVG